MCRKNGRLIEDKIGKKSEGWTARAASEERHPTAEPVMHFEVGPAQPSRVCSTAYLGSKA